MPPWLCPVNQIRTLVPQKSLYLGGRTGNQPGLGIGTAWHKNQSGYSKNNHCDHIIVEEHNQPIWWNKYISKN